MTTMNAQRAEVPAWVLTALGAAGQAIAVAVVIAVGSVGGEPAGAGAYLFALGFGVLLLFRSWSPVLVLVLSVAGVFGYYIADHPPIGMALPVFGALYAAAERGRVVAASVAGAVLLVVALYFRIQDGEVSAVLASDVITNAALIGCALALALSVRSSRHLRQERERAVLLERTAQQERAARAVEEQRLQLARDVHDSIGHALTLVSVQTRVAQQALETDHDAAASALERVVSATGSSLTDLRRTLATLRSDRDGSAHAPVSVSGIEHTAQAARDAGLEVDLVVDLGDAPIPGPVASAAFRIVQESVTNVLRHARADRVRIQVRVDGTDLRVEVTDDGRGAPGGSGGPAPDDRRSEIPGDRGIAGMRDRAELLGGSLQATPHHDGFTITAVLPLEEVS